MKKNLSLILVTFILFTGLNFEVQSLSKKYINPLYDPYSLIIVVEDNYKFDKSLKNFLEVNNIKLSLNLNPNLGGDTFLIDTSSSSFSQEELIRNLESFPGIQSADYDYYGELFGPGSVNDPNDFDFNKQWSYNDGFIFDGGVRNPANGNWIDVDSTLAKYIASESEEEVKVAVIDAGIDFTNPDLVGKIDLNLDEIPGNNIDDDNNGYIDDYYGASRLALVLTDENLREVFGDLGIDASNELLNTFGRYLRVLNDQVNPNNNLNYYEEYLRGFRYFDPAILDDDVLGSEDLDLDAFDPSNFNGRNYFLENSIGFDHGTAVTGLIAANTNNNRFISGLADQNVKIINYSAYDYSIRRDNRGEITNIGYGLSASSLISGLNYAVERDADIINLSLGNFSDADYLENQFERLNDLGILVVAAAGQGNIENLFECDPSVDLPPNGQNLDLVRSWDDPEFDRNVDRFYPAAYDFPNLIKVGAMDCDFKLSSFSNYGQERVDLVAPGRYIYSLSPFFNGSYYTGTSFAAPMVTSAAALLKTYAPELSNNEIKEYLIENVVTPPPLVDENLTNSVKSGGVLNAALPLLRVPPKNLKYSLDEGLGEYLLTWDPQHYLDQDGGYIIYHKSSNADNGWRKIYIGDHTKTCLKVDLNVLPEPGFGIRNDKFAVVSNFETAGYRDLEFVWPEVYSGIGIGLRNWFGESDTEVEEPLFLPYDPFYNSRFNFHKEKNSNQNNKGPIIVEIPEQDGNQEFDHCPRVSR